MRIPLQRAIGCRVSRRKGAPCPRRGVGIHGLNFQKIQEERLRGKKKKKKNKKRSRKGGLKPSPTLVNTAISFTSTFPVFLSRQRSRGQGLLLILAPFCFQRGQQQFRRWGRGRFRQRAIPAKAGLETIQANTRARCRCRCRRGREDGRITLGCRRRKKEKKVRSFQDSPKYHDNTHAKDH